VTDAGLSAAFRLLNRRWFDGALPASVSVRYARLDVAGLWTLYDDGSHDIEVNEGLRAFRRLSCAVLLHEMCHIGRELAGDASHVGHGGGWRAERRRLMAAGAFDPYL
jgi:hypothetical protein